MKLNRNRNTHLIIKILLIGSLIAGLIYLFHPTAGEFSVMINGEPVADPLARFAVIPTIFAVLFFTGILMVLVFLGAGLLVFLGALIFMMFGIFFMAPYFWPALIIIFFMIVLLSFDNKNT